MFQTSSNTDEAHSNELKGHDAAPLLDNLPVTNGGTGHTIGVEAQPFLQHYACIAL